IAIAIEKFAGFIDGEVEHLVNVLAVEADADDMALKTAPVAGFALHFKVGHEMHLNCDGAGAMATVATSALDVEREVASLHTKAARLWARGKELADFVVDLEVRRRIGAERSRRHLLAHMNHLANQIETLDPLASADFTHGFSGTAQVIVVQHGLD